MFSTIIFLVLLPVGLIQATPITKESCEARVLDSSDPCWSSVVVPRSCESATLNLGMTRFKSCNKVGLMWSYPLHNLTVTIETLFTEKRQPYAINIDNSLIKDYSIGIYRIIDGHETEVKSKDDVIVQNSDSNYQIILKFQGPSTIYYYGFPFNYDVTPL
ncbi:unnamed protein product [Rotaria sp. Silwood1]|nr:unnamed protein product [Rotaria sp. Silwood1]CAF1130342.1 unnamed protein product [Rotaria sp. Silwood1]CAF3482743.1 unnamed protein product [Rotaria sp. Silwood1]CAF4534855.1 unnamed protein product [Rotaria sp. Silwood1]CAF5015197.1 unnamed protein product [Rotaria sp. Silwood1]